MTLTSSSTLSQRISMSRFELTQDVLEAARDSLLEQETQIILADNISLEGLNYVSSLAWNNQLAGGCEENLIVRPNSYFVADTTIRPRNVPNPPSARACNSSGYEYPTMVVEVGLSQSIRNLHKLAPIYFSQRITSLIFLVLKIFHACQNNTRAIVTMLYQRTSQTPNVPVTDIYFGNAQLNNFVMRFIQTNVEANVTGNITSSPPCIVLNLPNYILNIPANTLFCGASGGVPRWN
ncbi:hypothetical protein C1646_767646 [Rhizophagus diaphanus]|nr:hypothetical protein C1646_767646 [Rhizophagus diaphanus] [Rhizophagus sp. MUCL 43196]